MSELLALGVSHKTAPLDLRERLALTEGRAAGVLRELTAAERGPRGGRRSRPATAPSSTWSSPTRSRPSRRRSACSPARPEIRPTELLGHLYSLRAGDAARHLFRVTAGLDSMIVGEAEIQGQVKRAYELALVEGATGPILNRLFRGALAAGERVRDGDRRSASSGVSIPSVAVELARRTLGDLAERRVLVIGAGETAELIARALVARGVETVFVANRHYDRAIGLAQRFGGEAVRFEELPEQLERGRHRRLRDQLAAPHRRARRARAGDGDARRAAAAADRHRRAARHRARLPRDRRGQPPRHRRRAADRRAQRQRPRGRGAAGRARSSTPSSTASSAGSASLEVRADDRRAARARRRDRRAGCWPRTRAAGRASATPTASASTAMAKAIASPPPARADPADEARGRQRRRLPLRQRAARAVRARRRDASRPRTPSAEVDRLRDAAPRARPVERLADSAPAAARWPSRRPSSVAELLGGAELVEVVPRRRRAGRQGALRARGRAGAARGRGRRRRPLGQGPPGASCRTGSRSPRVAGARGPARRLDRRRRRRSTTCPRAPGSAPRACAAARSCSPRAPDLEVVRAARQRRHPAAQARRGRAATRSCSPPPGCGGSGARARSPSRFAAEAMTPAAGPGRAGAPGRERRRRRRSRPRRRSATTPRWRELTAERAVVARARRDLPRRRSASTRELDGERAGDARPSSACPTAREWVRDRVEGDAERARRRSARELAERAAGRRRPRDPRPRRAGRRSTRRRTRERAAGVVYLVGAGPGDPGLLTARALELIARADAILYDRLIPPGALDGAREDAELVYVGKAAGRPSVPQEEIDERLVEARARRAQRRAAQGRRPVRLRPRRRGGRGAARGRGRVRGRARGDRRRRGARLRRDPGHPPRRRLRGRLRHRPRGPREAGDGARLGGARRASPAPSSSTWASSASARSPRR